ncbi:U3 small nucleolar RNA-associated protein 14 homolog C [Cloeon dipterum]|uniref:U3 small nucleolar RNA-associated protein 14 homolog C n=1 Tax=Cloeon dipterum TaxID=197152 RepID=UPI00321FA536
MELDQERISDDSDGENDARSHSQLVSAITKIDFGNKFDGALRKDPANASEYDQLKSKKTKNANKVSTAKVLKSAKTISVRRKKEIPAVPKPQEKIFVEKVKRSEGYIKVTNDLSKWDNVVESNRVADQLEFPAFNKDLKVHETNIMTSITAPKTELEKKVYSMLEQNGYIAPKEEGPKKSTYDLTMEEIIARRREHGDFIRKTIQHQKKVWQQNRIKSKKHHRIMRKDKMRKQIKEFESLKDKDPEEALKMLEAIDKTRVQERASLRHKNTGHWAKNQQIRAKYNKDIREVLAQQIKLSRELSQKVKRPEDESTDEGESEDEGAAAPHPDLDWEKEKKLESGADVASFVSGYKKYWEEKNKKSAAKAESDKEQPEEKPEQPEEKSASQEKLCVDVEEDEHLELMEDLLEVRKNQKEFEKNELGKNLRRKANVESVSKKEKKVKGQKKSAAAGSGSWLVAESSVTDLFDKLEQKQEEVIEKSLKRLRSEVKEMENKEKDEEEADAPSNKKKKKKRKGKNKSSKNEPKDVFGLKSLRQTEREVSKSSIENPITEGTEKQNSNVEKNDVLNSKVFKAAPNRSDANIDPTKFLDPKPLKSIQGELVVVGGEDLDADPISQDQKAMLAELFADDDVVDDFQKEKQELNEASKPKEVDLTLPGWGEWGGSNLPVSTRKRKKFILKPKVELPRKDRNLRNVIIYEGKDSGINQHQVSELPYPFTSVKEFEASIRAPIGRNWVPETAHKKLIAPKIVTRVGQKIEPMTIDVLLKEAKDEKMKIKAKPK